MVVSLLGAGLVFLMFVQGGQTLLFLTTRNKEEKTLLVNTFGHKWELTFTTLVTFGGAIFASFPLYYSTSFGGAYWLWIAILFLFVIQAVSYEYRGKAGNVFGARTYEGFLFLNGMFGTILLGVAVGTFFTGGEFIMNKNSLTETLSPTISYWANSSHGLDSIAVPFNLAMGIVVFLAARTLGTMYVIMQVDSPELVSRCKKQLRITAPAFVTGFVLLLIALFTMTGYSVTPETGLITPVKYKYFINMTTLVWPLVMLTAGVVSVLAGIILSLTEKSKYSFYITGAGVFFAVWSLLICAAFNNTAFFVSKVDPQMSLTLYNSSSSTFTLKVMAYASLLMPFVAGYIVYVWRALTRTQISNDDINRPDAHKY